MQRFLTDGPNVPLKDEYTVDPDKKHKVTRTIVKGGQDKQDEQQNAEEGEDAQQPQQQEEDNLDQGQIIQEEVELFYYRKPDIHDFNDTIEKYERLHETVQNQVPNQIRLGWL